MQYRMRTHPLSQEQIEKLLKESQAGSLATINTDGTPYITPIHFVYEKNHIYMHGLPAGQKISNIKNNPAVCFNIYHMDCLLFDKEEKPCDTNTKYQSVTIQGTISILEDIEIKKTVLKKIVAKYSSQLSDKELPGNMVKGTAVLELEISAITGKYYE